MAALETYFVILITGERIKEILLRSQEGNTA